MTAAQAYPLHWPAGWPRTKTRISSAFKADLAKALGNLEGSLRRFGADTGKPVQNVVVSSNYTLTDRSPADPGVAVYFTWDDIGTCIAIDRYAKLSENIQAIHHVIEAERTKMRHGGLNIVRAAFRGYAALPPPGAETPWNEVLGVARGASREQIIAAYRRLAVELHPDKPGGSADAMVRINAARDRALKEVG